MEPRKPAKFENPSQNFSEMSFVIYSRKTGKYLNQNFLQEDDQELCGWNSISQFLILLLWLVNPPCYLVKISHILKSNHIFPGNGREDKDFILTYLNSSMAEVSAALLLIFRFWPSSRGKGRSKFSINNQILQKFFSVLFARVLPLLKILAILDHIRGVGAQISPKKGYFVDAESACKTLEIFN